VRLQRLLLGVYQAVGPRVLDSSLGRRAFVGSYFLYKRWLEDPFAALARRRPGLFRGGHVLDVGANVGYTASVFAAAIDPGQQVHAFEPERRNFRVLEEVVERHGLTGRVVPVRAAVGASDGTVALWLNAAHHADHRVLTATLEAGLGRAAAAATEQVRLLALDGYVRERELDRIAFIKVDVQGYELEVCRGLAGLLEANPLMAVAVEYLPSAMDALGFRAEALLEFFAVRGYVAHALERDGELQTTSFGDLERLVGERGYVDVVFTRDAMV
jgi:FkbM family methyltransferase